MILTLIGMSGAGKTYWAMRLAARGFACFDCDALLCARVAAASGRPVATLTEAGRWMGLPYEEGFRRREALYLACEAEVLRDVAARAALCAYDRADCVIDTGGSAIYADAAIFERIRRCSLVVYLAVPASRHQRMASAYLANPLPLIWSGLFNQEPGESLNEAFLRCYSRLVAHREQLYEQYSDVRLAYSYHRRPGLTCEGFLHSIH